MFELFEINDFLNASTREKLIAEIRESAQSAAGVYGKEACGAVDSLVRKVSRVKISSNTSDYVSRMLFDCREKIERHFGVSINECEDAQFLHYRAGDFFVAHQDGNTHLIFDDSRFRKISLVIFLNAQTEEPAPETYQGGDLVFHGSFPNYSHRQTVKPLAGKLVAFRAETTHEVIPVEGGERFTIVSWFR